MHKESIPRNLDDSLKNPLSISDKQKKHLDSSVEAFIYDNLYSKIDESDYAVLYDNESNYDIEDSFNADSIEDDRSFLSYKRVRPVGRPNSPVRDLITALVMLDMYGWSHKMLFDNLEYNVLTRRAFGVYGLGERFFSETTFYNFQKKLTEYWLNTGVNLFELTFNKLTSEIVKKLEIKTGILRIDSFQAMSNIASYTKLRLLIELLRRVFRVLDEEEQDKYHELFSPYLKVSSGKFVYRLNKEDYSTRLEELAIVYNKVYNLFNTKYFENTVFKRFSRAFIEHFELNENEEVIPKDKSNFDSSILQSPDDDDATYRNKSGNVFKGQVVTLTESASLENKVNLILDVSIDANNVHDSTILASRIDDIKTRFTDIKEVHADGAYGSEETDRKLGDALIVTGIRGRKAKVKLLIEESDNNDFIVNCPFQEKVANKGRKRYNVIFESKICETCPLKDVCNLKHTKKGKVYYFTKEQATINMRNNRLYTIPEERKKLRANVEATVKEFSNILNHKGKFKVRGFFKTALHAIARSIGINLGRIFRFSSEKQPEKTLSFSFFTFFSNLIYKMLILSKFKTIYYQYKLNT